MTRVSARLAMQTAFAPIASTAYSLCGLSVRSEIPLPLPRSVSSDDPVPAWTIRFGDASERLAKPAWNWPATLTDEDAALYLHFQQGEDGFWFWWDNVAAAHLSSDARVVEVYPDATADEELLGSLLAGPLAAFVLGRLGYPLLHASAVATSAGAVVFLGRKGQGKSTMAAAFLQRGDALLTDDMLLLRVDADEVFAVPGPPVMRLWRPTAENTLGLSADTLPDVTYVMDKKRLWIDGQYAMVQRPVRISAIYVLDRYDLPLDLEHPISSRELAGAPALTAVLAQMYGPLTSAGAAAPFLPTFARLVRQARVRVLRFPTGFAWHGPVCQFILDEVAGR